MFALFVRSAKNDILHTRFMFVLPALVVRRLAETVFSVYTFYVFFSRFSLPSVYGTDQHSPSAHSTFRCLNVTRYLYGLMNSVAPIIRKKKVGGMRLDAIKAEYRDFHFERRRERITFSDRIALRAWRFSAEKQQQQRCVSEIEYTNIFLLLYRDYNWIILQFFFYLWQTRRGRIQRFLSLR